MRLIFVRHGEPNYEKDCLTPTGHLQAKAVAKRLECEKIAEIYSSPMGRARETMEKFSDLHNNLPVKILDFMHEITWGSRDGKDIPLDGHPWDIADEMVRQNMNLCDSDWRQNKFFKDNLAVDEVDRVSKEFDQWLLTLGYAREGFYYRNKRNDDSQKSIVLFCHGGSSSAALSHLLNITFPFSCASFHFPFTAVTIIRFDSRPGSLCIPIMELVSDARHVL